MPRPASAGLPVAGRVGVAAVLLAPLGLAMGMLFPSGLRLGTADATLPWAVNGVASVVGAVLATTLAIRFGYPVVSLAGAGLYAGLALVGPALAGSDARGRFRWQPRPLRRPGLPSEARADGTATSVPTGASSASISD